MLGQPLPSPNDRYYTQSEKQRNIFLSKTNIFLIKSNKCEKIKPTQHTNNRLGLLFLANISIN